MDDAKGSEGLTAEALAMLESALPLPQTVAAALRDATLFRANVPALIAEVRDLRARLAKAEAGQAAAEEIALNWQAAALAESQARKAAEERAKALEAALRLPTAAASRWSCGFCTRYLYDGDGDLVEKDAADPCSNCDPLRALLAAPAADPEVSRG